MGSVLVAIPHRTPLGFSSLLVFVLVALACAAITWRHPAVGIAGLLTCEPFDWAHDLGPTQITLGKVALLGVMLGLAARRTSLAPLRAQRVRPIVLGALAIGVVTALTAIPATYIDATARETLKAIEYLAVFAVAAIAVRDERDETLVVNALGALAIVVCGLALAQLTHAAGSGIIIAGRTIPRIAGPLEGPNQLAGYLDLVTVVFLAYAIVRRDAFSRVVLAIAFATDVLTLSRAGLLGVVAGGAIVFFARGDARVSRRFTAGAGALVAALALLAIRFGFAARFFSTNEVRRENGLGTRAELWTAALTLWRRDPALGIGAGNFELQLPAAGLIGVRTHANSLYLQSLAEGGIALFSAVVWTFVSAIALALRDARRSVYLLGFAGAASAFAIHQLGDFLTFFPKVGTLWAALLGLAVARIAALRFGRRGTGMSARPRVAFVVQRCGDEIAGGAEALCLASARTMAAHWDCEILTTCARDARSWSNEYPPGETIDGGVRIVRFAVDAPRDARAFDRASRRIASDSGSLAEQEAWMRLQGPYASRLFAHLERNGGTYDCVFFFSYLYATTYFGLPLVADRAILVALAHDEWTLELPLFDRIFASARACAFVSEEERLLVETRFASLSSLASLVRVAIEPRAGDAAHFREAFGIGEPFMLYVGRVEPAKGVDDLLAHFLALRAIDFKPMSLVLAGPIAMELPERSDVIALGRIAEDEKWNALAAADFVVVPSAYESLSIVALEAWAAGRAVLANGSSAVLVGQCRRSGGGLWYAQEREFVDLARSGLVGEAQRLGVQGARYVARTFTAASARDSLLAAYAAVHSAA